MERKIVVVGSIALDSIETPYGKVEEVLGGSAIHFSVAASFFVPVGIVGVIGDDFPPKYLKLLSQRQKIDLSGVKRAEGKTFRWRGYYKGDMNIAYTVETQLNVFENFIPEIPKEYYSSGCIFLANIDPELQYKVLSEVRSNNNNIWLTACDTMNFWIEHKLEKVKHIFSCVDIVIINEGEIRQIAEEANLLRAAKKTFVLCPGLKSVVVKRGEYGVVVFTRDSIFCLPGYLLEKVKDPTGAGDTFAGGFLGSLVQFGKINEKNLRRAAVYGSVLASFNVEDFGLRRLLRLSKDDIEKRYNEFKFLTHFC